MTKPPRTMRADGELTRNAILEAAGELFAAEGFAHVTSKAIAAHAGADQASINYHFGSRGGLYQAVLAEAHSRSVPLTDLRELAGSAHSAEQKLRLLIDLVVERAQHSAKGWPLQVLMQEMLKPSQHCQVLFQEVILPKLHFVRQVLAELTALAPDDPALTRCLLSVMGPCAMLLIGAGGLPGPVQETLQMPREVIVRHLHSYALAGLAAIAREHER